MSYSPYIPDKIYITSDAIDYPVSKQIMTKFDKLDLIRIKDISTIQISTGALLLTTQKANFYKNCPGTRNYICCGYQILNLVNNCEIGCSYCILQDYLNVQYITIYVNIDDLFRELSLLFNQATDRYFRIGTGELADSLSTDHITNYGQLLVEYFADKRHAILELKTKTTQIDNIIDSDHGGRTVVSWSLNTPRIIETEEKNAPTLEQRLNAARHCAEVGYKIGFHFDPMIYYPAWEREYHEVVDRIFDYIKPGDIIWISLGALRYPPHLVDLIKEHHPKSTIVYGELISGMDGKLRYFKALRIEMFNKMYRWLKHKDPHIFIYCCMENSDVWERSFGWSPGNSLTLKKMMDDLIR